MPQLRVPILILVIVLLLPQAVAAEVLSGKVVRIVDGDTVVLLDTTLTQHRIRLSGIDAPETKQPFGQKSKEHLSHLVAGQAVEVDWTKRDRYQRIVGKIIFDGQDVNLAQIRAGLAWWYRNYAREQSPVDRQLYEATEAKARTERVGLWGDPNPVPPWEWRHPANHLPQRTGVPSEP